MISLVQSVTSLRREYGKHNDYKSSGTNKKRAKQRSEKNRHSEKCSCFTDFKRMVRKEINMKVATTIRLPEEMKRAIEKEADRTGLSFNETVCVMLSDWLTNKAHRC